MKKTLMATRSVSLFNPKISGITSHNISQLLLYIKVSLVCANTALLFLILHPCVCSTHLAHYKRNKPTLFLLLTLLA